MLINALFIFNQKVNPKPGQTPSGIWTRNHLILLQCLNPLEHFLHLAEILPNYLKHVQDLLSSSFYFINLTIFKAK